MNQHPKDCKCFLCSEGKPKHPVEKTNEYIDLASNIQNEEKPKLILPPSAYKSHPDVEEAFAKNKVY